MNGRKAGHQENASESRVGAYGTFRDNIAIEVPTFHEIAPDLDLTYDSSGENGWLGVGWNIAGVSRIERARPGKGAPLYDANDIYLLDGEELVPCAAGSVSPSCTTGGTHSTKTESYVRVALSGTGTAARWTLTEKDGTKRVYAPVLTLPGPDGTAGNADDQVFRWAIQTVTDTHSNAVTYSWGKNQFGGLWEYLDSVTYGGTTIKVYYEQRTDIETAAVGGALESAYGRIKTIDVSVGSSRLRSYKLSYVTSGATSRSLLASVQQYGKDATLDASGTVTGGTSLPAITAGYPATSAPVFSSLGSDTGMYHADQQRLLTMDVDGDGKTEIVDVNPGSASVWRYTAGAFTKVSQTTIPTFDWAGRFLAMDVNGDGKDDLVTLTVSGSQYKRTVYLSNGTSFTAGATDTSIAYEQKTIQGYNGAPDTLTVATRFVAGDVNGDGKSDMIVLNPGWYCFTPFAGGCLSGKWYYWRNVWLSNGSGFDSASNERGISYDLNTQFFAGDFDGDGKSDLLELNPGDALYRRVYTSNGTTLTQSIADSTYFGSGMKFLVADINADGKTDLVELLGEGIGTRRKTYLSTGSSFQQQGSTWLAWAFGGARYVTMDVNGDGKSDYVAMTPNFLEVRRTVFLSNGADFVQGTNDILGNQGNHRYLAADVNGDGRSELVELFDDGSKTKRITWSTGGDVPDLLTSRTTGLGATTTVTYAPSSAWPNANNPPITQTVTGATVTDGRGGSSTTSYSYSGGRYDPVEQRFVGFGYVKQTEPCIAGETACPYTETAFNQDFGAVALPSWVNVRDGSGALLRAWVIQYQTNGSTVPWTALPVTRADLVCLGTRDNCKTAYTARTYNAYGEITAAVDGGDLDVTGDEVTTLTTFYPNTTAYIVNLPGDVKTFQGIDSTGTLLNETISYYDGATSYSVPPSAGDQTKLARWLSSPSAFVVTQNEYDAWGNVTATVDPLGARTTTTYDAGYHRFPTSMTNAVNRTVTTTWEPVCGSPVQTTNVNGQATTLTYDALCRLAKKTLPGGKFESHTWANLGDPANQYEQIDRPGVDGSGNWWSRRRFDGLSRTWREVKKGPDASTGNIYVDTTYTARGEQASVTAPYYWTGSGTPAIQTTTYGYDALDRPTVVTFPGGAQQTTSYGLWSATTTDELGRAKTDRFDARGQRIAHDETVGGLTKTTTYAYDGRQTLRQSTDPAGNVITYTTDSFGKTRSIVDPAWGTTTYDYDAAGRLISQVDAKGQTTLFTYDELGRKKTKKTLAGTAQESTVSWTYDESHPGFYNIGALTTVTDGAGTKQFDYDVAGHVVNSARSINGTSYLFQYGFDADDRPLWTTYPDGDMLGTPASPLLYDGAGRLKSIPGYVTTALYGADDLPTQITNANGTVTTRSYSPTRGWLTGINTVAASSTVIQNLVYTRNDKGVVTQVQSLVGNEGWSYGYDELDRVTSATNTTVPTNSQTLAYDAIGNITSNSLFGTYSYGARPQAVTAAGGNTYAYDLGGLMVSGAGRTLTWNGDNLLASATLGGTTSTYTYDADGNRIQQQEGPITRRYLGDDYETDGSGNITKYVSLDGLLVARKDGATKLWLHTDHLGSIQAETASSGAEVQRRKYRPYGDILSDSESLEFESRGYTGQRHDASGLVYLHARYYDPALGRFISPDPIVDGSDTVGLNRYAYVGNSPVNATDPSGLAAVMIYQAQRAALDNKNHAKPPPPPPPPPPRAPRPPSYPYDSDPRPGFGNVPTSPVAGQNRGGTQNKPRLNVVRPSLGTPKKVLAPRPATAKPGDNKRGSGIRVSVASASQQPGAKAFGNRIPLPGTLDNFFDCIDHLSDVDFEIEGAYLDVSGGAIVEMCEQMHP